MNNQEHFSLFSEVFSLRCGRRPDCPPPRNRLCNKLIISFNKLLLLPVHVEIVQQDEPPTTGLAVKSTKRLMAGFCACNFSISASLWIEPAIKSEIKNYKLLHNYFGSVSWYNRSDPKKKLYYILFFFQKYIFFLKHVFCYL